jgi:hypothetical protein
MLELLNQLMIDCTALSDVFDDIVGCFEDAANIVTPGGNKDQQKTQK